MKLTPRLVGELFVVLGINVSSFLAYCVLYWFLSGTDTLFWRIVSMIYGCLVVFMNFKMYLKMNRSKL